MATTRSILPVFAAFVLNCVTDPAAALTTTTTSFPPTSSTTTSSTTSSEVPGERTCMIAFRLVDTPRMSAIAVNFSFDKTLGRFRGLPSALACEMTTDALYGSFYQHDIPGRDPRYALIGASTEDPLGFQGPFTIAYCAFTYTTDPPAASDFTLLDGDARDAHRAFGDRIVPAPEIEVESVQCPIDTATTTTTVLPPPRCAHPETNGSLPNVTDALMTLLTSIDYARCPPCICDVDGNGFVVATDALRILRSSTGENVSLSCPDCGSAEVVLRRPPPE